MLQAVSSVGLSQKEAITYYEKFVQDGIALGKRPELVGGGLVRSVGDWLKETLRLSSKIKSLSSLAGSIEKDEGITGLRSGSRTRKVSKARRLFCHSAVGKMGHPGAEVARFFGVTTSAVARAAKTEELKEVQKYL